jgi:hypothetical protein
MVLEVSVVVRIMAPWCSATAAVSRSIKPAVRKAVHVARKGRDDVVGHPTERDRSIGLSA